MDPSNSCDTQNFGEAFLNMKPVIRDEIIEDMAQERERTDLGSTDGEDLVEIPALPRILSTHSFDDLVDAFEAYTFDDRPSIVGDSIAGDREEEEDSETAAETVPEDDDPTEETNFKTQLVALWSSTHTPQRGLGSPEREPSLVDTQAKLAPFTNTTLLAIPDIQIQTHVLSADTVGDADTEAASARHHLGPEPKFYRHQPNVRRSRRAQEKEKASAPVHDPHLSDTEDDYADDDVRSEELDNCPQDFANIDVGSDNGPRSIKTVSHHMFSAVKNSPDTWQTD